VEVTAAKAPVVTTPMAAPKAAVIEKLRRVFTGPLTVA
jgi:hypothetical protein